jgi:PAS domain S-box-containing protein
VDTDLPIPVLLVDDNAANLVAMAGALEGLGATVVTARSGEEALRCLLKDDFAAILMDVRMPVLDGFETAEIIRQRQRARDTPIIFVTAISQADEHVARGYSLGAVDYVFKPVRAEVLRSKIAVFVDLARKRALITRQAELLRRSEARYRQLVEGMPATVYTAGLEAFGATRYVSPQIEALLGFPQAAWTSEPGLFARQLHPGDRRLVLRQFARAVARRAPFSTEYRMLAADGRVVWVRDEGRIVEGAGGEPDQMQGVRLDVTDLRQTQEALREVNQTLEAMLRAAPVAVFLVDLTGAVRLCNPAAARMFGRAEREFLGAPAPFASPERPEEQREALARIVAGEESSWEFAYPRGDGETVQVLLHASPIRDRQGAATGVVAVLVDVTASRRGEAELRRAKEAAELANTELETFNSAVAHDLRAPLRSITGFSEELLDDHAARLDADGQYALQRIIAGAEWMGQLIDDLLHLSHCTHAAMRDEVVDLGELAHACLDELARGAPSRRVDVRIDPALVARGDPRLLRVALENLLSNSWKFTSRKASATIEVGRDPHTGAFFVRDDGAGFDMSHASQLFEAFQRLHRADEFEGNGIGLITVKRIIERHGGSVAAVGALGKGATFSFTLGSG